jgi:3-phenylpropionate/trans-cinnamate dioxygenase ferredoxin reductase subunit
MNTDAIVIVGGGHAAAALCAALAAEGQGARVHLVCAEPHLPYQRPPLSKGFIKDPNEAPQWHRDAAWYPAQGITVHAADPAQSIEREARALVLSSGLRLPYRQLVLATGTRARTLPELSASLANVATLRTAADAQRLRGWLHARSEGELLVLGGGFIGLEVAATARQLGWAVRVLEVAPRLLARATSTALSEHILQHHRGMGTDVVLNAAVGGFRVDGDHLSAMQVDGAEVPVSHLLLSVGAVPEVALATAAGLEVDNGIRVDASLCSSDPTILAIGDCAGFEYLGRRIRLESVQNANDQARVAAATLLGRVASYQPTPFFWSDQGGLRLQMVGLWREGLQAVRRNGPTDTSFSLFHYDGGVLVAVESVNAPIDHINARKLLEAGRSPPPAQVADPQVALKSLL